jgi:homocysteine S-methyltransferase
VGPAIEVARRVTGLPAVAYPNLGERWDNASHAWVGDGEYDVSLAAGWVAQGAAMVGGCCRVGPERIARLRSALRGIR